VRSPHRFVDTVRSGRGLAVTVSAATSVLNDRWAVGLLRRDFAYAGGPSGGFDV
jgi:hypothetical protein